MTISAQDAQALLRRLFQAAVDAARPDETLTRHLPSPPAGRTVVLGAGKAAAAMARAVERVWPGPIEGTVVVPYGYAVACERIEVVKAAHPVPDEAGQQAARRMLAIAGSLGAADLALCLISGGGSALLSLPRAGLALADKQRINRDLLASGAPIGAINTVRRHLSAIKGGRLAAACHPARVVTLLVSDVPGDAPCDIASGPTVGDSTTADDALAVLDRYGIDLPAAVRRALEEGGEETVKPDDPRLAGATASIVATPQRSLEAAAAAARAAGWQVHILSDAIEGEARDVATALAAVARQVASRGQPFAAPCILLSGGETTVSVRGSGRGGRNVEFLLAAAIALRGLPGVHALAADTDGVDGAEPVAGAVIGPDTLTRAEALGLDPRAMLAANDAHRFFAALEDQVVTGPTLTNVNDFRAILIAP